VSLYSIIIVDYS